ncbi:MAG: TolC family protein [Helicobacteraceae bacterium]|nr:TolC family protein [Helicobacteraceae bacterium]
MKYLVIFGIFIVSLFGTDNTDIFIEKMPDDTAPLNEVFIPTISPNTQIKDLLDKYENTDGILSLKELLEMAKNNYTLQAKNIAIKEAEATRDSVIGRYVPSLDVGYSFNSTKSYINSSWERASNAHQTSATANWVLFDGASREFSLLSNNALVRAAIADKGYSEESVFLQVISYYYQYFSIKGQIIAMEQKRVNIAANVARIQVLYDAGLEPLDSLEALKAELSSTEYQLETLKLDFDQTKLQLSLFTNTDIDKLKLNQIKKPEEKEIQSLNITMQEEQALSVEYQVGTITYWPTISLFDTYYFNFKNNQSESLILGAGSFAYMQNPKHQNVFGLSITWNIFSGFTTNRQKEAFQLANLRMQKNIAYAKEEQKNNIKFYKRSIMAALSQIESAKASLKSASIAFDTVAQKYLSQLVNYNTYLDALIMKYNAESTYIQSLNNYELQKANYIFYSGQMLLDYIN